MNPSQALTLRTGDLVVLRPNHTPPGATATMLQLWAVPGTISDEVSEPEKLLVDELTHEVLGVVLSVYKVPRHRRVVNEPVEVFVLTGHVMGWTYASNVFRAEASQ